MDGETIVSTTNGLRRIKDVVPSNATISRIDLAVPDETGIGLSEYGYWETDAETLEIVTNEGFRLIGTAEHKVRTVGGGGSLKWTALEDLSVGEYVAISAKPSLTEFVPQRIRFSLNKRELSVARHSILVNDNRCEAQLDDVEIDLVPNDAVATLFGLLLSEGSVLENGFRISNTDFALLDSCEDALRDIGLTFSRFPDNRREVEQQVVSCECLGAAEWLRQLGFCQKSSEKRVPAIMLGMPRSLTRQWLRAYFESDGGLNGGRISAYSTSVGLLTDIQTVLLSLGIFSRVSTQNKTCSNCRDPEPRKAYQLDIDSSSIGLFEQEVGFVSERKKSLLRALASKDRNQNKDTIPYWQDVVLSLRGRLPIKANGTLMGKRMPRWNSNISAKCKSHSALTRTNVQGVRRYFARAAEILGECELSSEILSRISELERIVASSLFFVRVSQVRSAGRRSVFDLAKLSADHSFYANGFVNHNTSVARILAAMENCEKGPTTEPCGKCGNCEAIFTGKSVDVKEVDAASSGSIEGIRQLREEIRYAPQNCRVRYVILDECLSRYSRVETEIGKIPVGVIVSNKLTPKVKSYNHSTRQIEYRKITGWFKNSGKECYKVASEGSGCVYCSDGHLFGTPEGYKPLRDLSVGDKILRYGHRLNAVQEQLVLGSLLGDMSIQRNSSKSQDYSIDDRMKKSCRCRIKMVHGENQFDYIDFKYSLLSNIVVMNKKDFIHSGFEGYAAKPMRSYCSKTSSAFSEIYDLVVDSDGCRPKKRINKKWLDKIGLQGLAFWFCDDGSTHWTETKNGLNPVVTFSSEGFNKAENELLASWLTSLGYKSKVLSSGRNGLYHISLTTQDSRQFIVDISPYVHPSVRYKIDKLDGIFSFNKELFDNDVEVEVVPEVITEIKSLGYQTITYDIEVEGNNNYFVSGTLVHNCHRLSGAAAEASLKMIEEPPPNVRFILATTDPQLLKNTIHSRCIKYVFNKVHWSVMLENLKKIAFAENILFDDDALKIAATTADGSVRNSLQNLQTLISFVGEGNTLTAEAASQALGAIGDKHFFMLMQAISNCEAPKALQIIDQMFQDGRQAGELSDGLYRHLRNLMLAVVAKNDLQSFGFTTEDTKRYQYQADQLSLRVILDLMELVKEINRGLSYNMDPQQKFEEFIVRSIIVKKLAGDAKNKAKTN
ncbi:MAG: hypothetical protein HC888_00180 [Candidatus Competibacteraceae bacterium]|nr:hypothetical protein [Candidatus Competibacteraceae bacterium]